MEISRTRPWHYVNYNLQGLIRIAELGKKLNINLWAYTASSGATLAKAVEARLLIPMGLRSLAPGEPGYVGHYGGGPLQRDSAYHQGMAWPWLIGPFVEAWVRVHGSTAEVRRDARERFVAPLYRHLDEAGLGHVSEIADAEPPFTPRGCPFQAWSLGEILRLEHSVLAE